LKIPRLLGFYTEAIALPVVDPSLIWAQMQRV
jgi:hypothetical protein